MVAHCIKVISVKKPRNPTSQRGQIEARVYRDGRLESVKFIDDKTNGACQHKVGQDVLSSLFGPYAGKKK